MSLTKQNQSAERLSLSLSLHFNSHFPGVPGLAGTRMSLSLSLRSNDPFPGEPGLAGVY